MPTKHKRATIAAIIAISIMAFNAVASDLHTAFVSMRRVFDECGKTIKANAIKARADTMELERKDLLAECKN